MASRHFGCCSPLVFFECHVTAGGSEANLIASLKLGDNAAWLVVFVATLGNTLGGMTNYWLGRLLPDKTSDEKHGHKALQWLKKNTATGRCFSAGYPLSGILCVWRLAGCVCIIG